MMRRMKLSYQVATPEIKRSWNVTAYQATLRTSFQALKNQAYDGVELMVARPSIIDAIEIVSLTKELNLPISMICTGEIFGQEKLSFSDPAPETRELAIDEVKAAIRLAEQIEAPGINVGRVRGGITLDGDQDEERKRSLDGLAEVARYGERRNVLVLLEPVNSIAANFINSTKDGLDVIKSINEPFLKLMIDSNHMYIEDHDMFDSIRQAKDEIKFVHLADSNRLYPGNCKIDFATFLSLLDGIGYKDWFSVEVFQRPDQDTALERSISYLRKLDNFRGDK